MHSCMDCGESVYDGDCINCNSAFFIQKEYMEQDMDVPHSILVEVGKQIDKIEKTRIKNLKRRG